jgi:hypothetical protein
VVEKLVLRQPPDAKPETRSAAELIRRKIARRAAAEFRDGMNINLGMYIYRWSCCQLCRVLSLDLL